MVTEQETEEIDLFDDFDNLPPEIQDIFNGWRENGCQYKECARVHDLVYKLGYTFDSGLDAVPYNLRKL